MIAGTKINRLSRAEMFSLARWMEQHLDDIRESRMSADVIAAKASDAVGFSVTRAMVRNTAKDAGIELPNRNQSSKGRKTDRTRRLARIVASLFDKFGEAYPADLTALLNGDKERA
jgi:hypothetical protein